MFNQLLMKITIRKSVLPSAKENIPLIIERALAFLSAKFPTVNFDNVDLIFSGSGRRGRYFRNEKECAKYNRPTAFIPTQRKDELLYWKPSLLMVRDTVTNVGAFDVATACLIHELTHHMQYEKNIRRGELETTKNELEYYKQYRPDVYQLFMEL